MSDDEFKTHVCRELRLLRGRTGKLRVQVAHLESAAKERRRFGQTQAECISQCNANPCRVAAPDLVDYDRRMRRRKKKITSIEPANAALAQRNGQSFTKRRVWPLMGRMEITSLEAVTAFAFKAQPWGFNPHSLGRPRTSWGAGVTLPGRLPIPRCPGSPRPIGPRARGVRRAQAPCAPHPAPSRPSRPGITCWCWWRMGRGTSPMSTRDSRRSSCRWPTGVTPLDSCPASSNASPRPPRNAGSFGPGRRTRSWRRSTTIRRRDDGRVG